MGRNTFINQIKEVLKDYRCEIYLSDNYNEVGVLIKDESLIYHGYVLTALVREIDGLLILGRETINKNKDKSTIKYRISK